MGLPWPTPMTQTGKGGKVTRESKWSDIGWRRFFFAYGRENGTVDPTCFDLLGRKQLSSSADLVETSSEMSEGRGPRL